MTDEQRTQNAETYRTLAQSADKRGRKLTRDALKAFTDAMKWRELAAEMERES